MPATICGFEVHPAAELFPLMDGSDFRGLIEDIRANGQMEPLVLSADGLLIDGRNRGRACERLGIDPVTKVYDGTDVLAFVISHNLHRRHLTDSQRAMIAAKLATRAPGMRREILESTSSYEEVPPSIPEAAQMLAVSQSSVQKAKIVRRDGTEALQALVSEGHTPVATAARVAIELAPTEQDAYVDQVRAGADPVKAAPPDLAQQARARGEAVKPPRPPVMGGNRRKHAAQLDALITGLQGYVLAFDGIDELDASVTSEEAARLTGDLSKSIRGLTRINQLIKERTS